MTCRRCHGCMAQDHFLDLQESGGDWWLQGWRCINCGHVFDPVIERNRRLHAEATATAPVHEPLQAEPVATSEADGRMDIAA